MTNEQKFTNAEERNAAYRAYITDFTKPIIGQFEWLALEAEEEKPEPCPFCGGETHINLGHLKAGVVHYWVDCISPECMYRSAHYTDRDTAIATHNRFARAARMAKESEAGQ